ncbi:MAG: glycosyltransferase family 39 protein [Myxococcota bacterium]|nr:glycosyltransferase family 39 protein [Myxococcota bacterium]
MRDPNRLLIVLLMVCTAVVWSATWHLSSTYDEPQHLQMGLQILRTGDFSRFDNSKMPVTVFNALPWIISGAENNRGSWFLARMPQVIWLLGTTVLVFVWVRRHYTAWAALGAATLVALDPNLMAHAGMVTTDAPCMFFMVVSCFTWARALEKPTRRNHIIAGVVFGLAQAAKFTAVFLVPIHLLIAAATCFRIRTWRPLRHVWAAILAALLSLNLAYGFQGTGTNPAEIQWRSEMFSPISESTLPLPVPRAWIEGLDWVKSDDDMGHGNIWLDESMSPMGRKSYFFQALAWKLPIPLLLLGLVGLLRGTQKRDLQAAWVIPPVFLLAWFSLAFNFQLGVRYLLPIVPFLAMWTARLSPRWLAAGAAWTVFSGLSWWPWLLSYQNETLLDRTEAWKRLADSNLDWGQGQHIATQWLEENPGGQVDPEVAAPGRVLLSANVLTGVLGDPARHACIREHLPPEEHLAYAHYPMNHAPESFEACYPRVETSGSQTGSLPAGTHLVILRFRGEATLSIGDWSESGSSNGESLIGAVVHSQAPFDAHVTHEGAEVHLYLDGRKLELP